MRRAARRLTIYEVFDRDADESAGIASLSDEEADRLLAHLEVTYARFSPTRTACGLANRGTPSIVGRGFINA